MSAQQTGDQRQAAVCLVGYHSVNNAHPDEKSFVGYASEIELHDLDMAGLAGFRSTYMCTDSSRHVAHYGSVNL